MNSICVCHGMHKCPDFIPDTVQPSFGVRRYSNLDAMHVDGQLVLASDYDALLAERDALQQQVESLQKKWAQRPLSVADTAALEAENDALRADAERYRWICNGNGYFMEEHGICGPWSEGHPEDKAEADKVIDAQMRKSPVEGDKHG